MSPFGPATIVRMLSLGQTLTAVLALLALLVVLAADGAPVAGVTPLLPLVLLGLWRRDDLLAPPTRRGGIARGLPARALVLAAVAAQLQLRGDLGALALLVVLLAGGALAAEPMLRSLRRLARPFAANLPGREDRNRPALPYGIVFPLSLLTLALLALAGTFLPGPLTVLALVAALATVLLSLTALADCAGRIRERRRFQAQLPQVLTAMAPVFYLYWSAPARSAHQITMWLPHLERLGVPFAIVVRTGENFRQAIAATSHPVILRRSLTDLEDLIVPSVRGVFYVNNAMLNTHMVRYSSLTHIQLLHGESDKAASATPVMRMYDRDFVAGQAAIDRFARAGIDVREDLFRIVGRPQVAQVQEARGPIAALESPTVLYAPTWRGYQTETDHSSLPHGPELVRALLRRGCRVVFRPHPQAAEDAQLRAACAEIRALLREDTVATGREHLHGPAAETERDVIACFNEADAMISDVSAVVGDFLHSGKPLAMISPHMTVDDFLDRYPTAHAAYVLAADGDRLPGLEQMLDALLGQDPLAQQRRRTAVHHLGDIPRESYADRFVEVARDELGLTPDQEMPHRSAG